MSNETSYPQDVPSPQAILADIDRLNGVVVALRLAATLDDAPKRCPRRDCRRLGLCRAEPDAEGEPRCRAGIGQEVIDCATGMLLFPLALARPEWQG